MLPIDKVYIAGYQESYDSLKKKIVLEDTALTYYREYTEKLLYVDLLGKTVKISPKQFSFVYEIVDRVTNDLEMDFPDVFVYEDFYYGVEAKGSEKPWIEISAKTIRDLDVLMIAFLVVRECFKIKIGACLTKVQALVMLETLAKNPVFIGRDISEKAFGLHYAYWCRLLEYSADQAAYLYIKDIKKAVEAILILVLNNVDLAKEVDIQEFIKQGEQILIYNEEVARYTKADEKIPYVPFRLLNLFNFATEDFVLSM